MNFSTNYKKCRGDVLHIIDVNCEENRIYEKLDTNTIIIGLEFLRDNRFTPIMLWSRR